MNEAFAWENRQQLVHEVAKVIRERIYGGHYGPGDALRQVQLSDEFKVSRTPIREAFRLLEQEGLVQSGKGSGVRVVDYDLGQFLDAYAIREMLDGLAAREAAGRASEAEIRNLFEIVDRQRAAIDPWNQSEYTSLNVEFHATIFDLTGNKLLSRDLPIIRMTSQVFRPKSLLDHRRAVQAVDEHTQIAEIIREGDPEAAENVARQHIRRTIDGLNAIRANAK